MIFFRMLADTASRKNYFLAVIFTLPAFSIVAQGAQDQVLREGQMLYRLEMAAWNGTDVFLARFKERQASTEGYFSYAQGDRTRCVFFSRDAQPQILAAIEFDSSFNVEPVTVDTTRRAMNETERVLAAIRRAAVREFRSDSMFRMYKNMRPNFIPVSDEKGKRVYVLTGPATGGIVVFGNDYLLTFDENDRVISKRSLHKNLITIDTKGKNGKALVATMHTHLPETGDLITATDVCTLMLYAKFVEWNQHYVVSGKAVSVWDCRRNSLVVMTRNAWDRINGVDMKKKE